MASRAAAQEAGRVPTAVNCSRLVDEVLAYHRLQAGSGQHELHLLSQHGRRRLLLDQVVAAVDLQLGFQMRWRVKVLAVLSRTPALESERHIVTVAAGLIGTGQKNTIICKSDAEFRVQSSVSRPRYLK